MPIASFPVRGFVGQDGAGPSAMGRGMEFLMSRWCRDSLAKCSLEFRSCVVLSPVGTEKEPGANITGSLGWPLVAGLLIDY